MKTINRRTFYQTRMKADGTEYTLYSYEVVDELGNKEVIDSLQEFKKGDRVETWYQDKYNKPAMRLYKEKRAGRETCWKLSCQCDCAKQHKICRMNNLHTVAELNIMKGTSNE